MIYVLVVMAVTRLVESVATTVQVIDKHPAASDKLVKLVKYVSPAISVAVALHKLLPVI